MGFQTHEGRCAIRVPPWLVCVCVLPDERCHLEQHKRRRRGRKGIRGYSEVEGRRVIAGSRPAAYRWGLKAPPLVNSALVPIAVLRDHSAGSVEWTKWSGRRPHSPLFPDPFGLAMTL